MNNTVLTTKNETVNTTVLMNNNDAVVVMSNNETDGNTNAEFDRGRTWPAFDPIENHNQTKAVPTTNVSANKNKEVMEKQYSKETEDTVPNENDYTRGKTWPMEDPIDSEPKSNKMTTSTTTSATSQMDLGAKMTNKKPNEELMNSPDHSMIINDDTTSLNVEMRINSSITKTNDNKNSGTLSNQPVKSPQEQQSSSSLLTLCNSGQQNSVVLQRIVCQIHNHPVTLCSAVLILFVVVYGVCLVRKRRKRKKNHTKQQYGEYVQISVCDELLVDAFDQDNEDLTHASENDDDSFEDSIL